MHVWRAEHTSGLPFPFLFFPSFPFLPFPSLPFLSLSSFPFLSLPFLPFLSLSSAYHFRQIKTGLLLPKMTNRKRIAEFIEEKTSKGRSYRATLGSN